MQLASSMSIGFTPSRTTIRSCVRLLLYVERSRLLANITGMPYAARIFSSLMRAGVVQHRVRALRAKVFRLPALR